MLRLSRSPGFLAGVSLLFVLTLTGLFGVGCDTGGGGNPPGNQPPTASSDVVIRGAEDAAVSIRLLDFVEDPDGDVLTVDAVVAAPAHGILTAPDTSGSAVYTPATDFNGWDSIQYRVADARGATVDAVIEIEVVAVNDPPIAGDDVGETLQGTSVTIDVVANDLDVDGDLLTVGLLPGAGPTFGSAVLKGDGTLTYTPEPFFSGIDSLRYELRDPSDEKSEALVTVTVIAVGPPEATDDHAVTAEDTPVTIDVLANDVLSGGSQTLFIATDPDHGTVVVNGDLTVEYTPAPDFFGDDELRYTIVGAGGSGGAVVHISITAVNDVPIAKPDVATTAEENPIVIDVLANDSDVDGDFLSVTVTSNPGSGTALMNSDRTITYRPNVDFAGLDAFTYNVTDPAGLVAAAEVVVTVTPLDDPPRARDDISQTQEDVSVSISVLANDDDPDGEPLSVVEVTEPLHGRAVIEDGGTITYTPNANFFGPDAFQYSLRDSSGNIALATVLVTVTSVDDPPTVGGDIVGTTQDQPVTIQVLANDQDPDGDPLTVVAVTAPLNGWAVLNLDQTITYTPAPGFRSTDVFHYTVADPSSLFGTAAVTVIVDPSLPEAEADSAVTDEDQGVTIDVAANDRFVDPFTLSIASAPQNGSAIILGGQVLYTPGENFSGVDTFQYSVSGPGGGPTSGEVTVTVNPVNDRPTAVDDSGATLEDTPTSIQPLQNDIDVDGDTLSVARVSEPAHGTVDLALPDTIVYTPAPNYYGTDVFQYTMSDRHGETHSAWVTIVVSPVNDSPSATPDSAQTAEDIPVALDVVANDTDVDGDPLTLTMVGIPAHGIAVFDGAGVITYTPNPDYAGTDSFEYTVEDPSQAVSIGTVTLLVTPVNDTPIALPDERVTDEDVPIAIDVLINDSDADGDAITIMFVTSGSHGTTVINPDSTITYTPLPDYHGSDRFEYTIEDAASAVGRGVVTLTIHPTNDAPVAADDSAVTTHGNSVTIPVLDNDVDVDGDPLRVAAVTQPSHGEAVVNTNGTIIYNPAPTYVGTDLFEYTVSDTRGGTATASVQVIVDAIPAQTADDAVGTNEDAAVLIDVLANDSFVNPLTIEVVTPAAGGVAVVESSGAIRYTPAPNFNGTDSFEYEASGFDGVPSRASVTVNVQAVNDPPVAGEDIAFTLEDRSLVIAVLDNDTDVDGDNLTVANVGTPGNGSAVINGNGTLTYTPHPEYHGFDAFQYTVADPQSSTSVGSVFVTIDATNDSPFALDDHATTSQGMPVTVSVLQNDIDVDGDTLVITGVVPPAHGSAVINGDQSITYTPLPAFVETEMFEYTVSDPSQSSSTATVIISINANPPQAFDDTAATNEDQSVEIDVVANDEFIDSSTLNIALLPQNGTASLIGTSIHYAPDPDFNGVDFFQYTVSGAGGGLDSALVMVTVIPVNDVPVGGNDTATTPEDTSVVVHVLLNDVDGDGDVLTIVQVSAPTHGVAALNADGSVSYTPSPEYHGEDAFQYTVSDSADATAVSSVFVTVTPVNDAPVAHPDTAETTQGKAVTIAVTDNDSDVDGDPVSVNSVADPSFGAVVINGDGTITYTPIVGFTGIESFEYRVRDPFLAVGASTVTVTVIAASAIVFDDEATTNEDAEVIVDILANDMFANSETLAITSPPPNGTASVTSQGRISYLPRADFNGEDALVYSVSGFAGEPDMGRVRVSVIPVNDPPVAQDDAVVTAEDVSVVIDAAANDMDVDGDLLVITSVGEPAHGVVTVSSEGTLNYLGNPNYYGSDEFEYTVSDARGETATAIVLVTIESVNDVPVAVADVATTLEDTPVVIVPLQNDTDIDGDPLTIHAVASPSHGSVVINLDETLTYMPPAVFVPTEVFEYTVQDPAGATAVATVTVTIDRKPVQVRNDAVTVREDESMVIPVLANDEFFAPGTLVVKTPPQHGIAFVTENGIEYAPDPDYHGSDLFVYSAAGFGGDVDDAIVSITVEEVNDPPVAFADHASTSQGTPVIIAVLANDQDVDGDPLAVATVAMPANGDAAVNPDGTITYTPFLDFIATEVFSYTMTDSFGATASASVTVVIDPNPPIAVDDATTTNEDEAVVVAVLANDSFVDPDSLVISVRPTTGTAVVGAAGTILYTPDPDTFGSDTLQYSISGPGGGVADAMVSITVVAVNDAPVATDDTATTDEDVPVTVAVISNDTDIDGDPLTVSLVSDPAAGTAVVNADRSITYTPDPDGHGMDTFQYTLSDSSNAMAVGRVTVAVNAVNDAPVAYDDNASTPQGIPVTIDVLTNDQDVDGDTLAVTAVGTPVNGDAVVHGDGTITYTPSIDFIATEVFPYTVTDPSGATASASVTVVIDPNPPVAVDDIATTTEDEAVVVAALANDSFVDSGSLVISVPPAHGSAVVGAAGTILYTPDAHTFGVDMLQYSVSGPGGGVADAFVSITVIALNDAPVATDDTATTDEDASVTVAVTLNDTDVDGDPLTVTLVSDPAAGTVVLNPDQSITYTPDSNAHGLDTFQYTIKDPSGATAVGRVVVIVNPVNDPPVALDDDASTPQGTAVTIAVLANDQDLDGDTLAVTTVATPANGTLVLNGDGTITYTPFPDFIATEVFPYTVTDPSGATSWATVTVVIDPNPPVANEDHATTNEDETVVIAVLANDSFVDPSSLAISASPTNGTAVVGVGGMISYTPDPDTFGGDTLKYSVAGSGGGVAGAFVFITVTSINDPPEAVDDTATTDEDVPVTIPIILNDVDVDGDQLTVTVVGNPAAGTAILNSDQSLTYTPDPNAYGSDTLQYTLNDPSNASAVGQVTVIVSAVNDAPVAFDDNVSTPQGTPVTIAVLANDQDVDGDTLTVASIGAPANGSAVPNVDGSITYTPAPDFIATEVFSYTLTDPAGAVASANVTVVIDANPPLAVDDGATTNEDETVVVSVLANDSFVDPASLVISVPPVSGTAVVGSGGTIAYTPDADTFGVDTLQYSVSGPGGGIADAFVSITVTAVNDAPVATDDAATTDEDLPVTIAVLVNDTDVDGDTLTVTVVNPPGAGTAISNPDQTITYTPHPDAHGPDVFQYTLSDASNAMAVGRVTVAVNAVNDAPMAFDDNVSTPQGTPVTIAVLANDQDVDGDTLTVASIGTPANGSAVQNVDGSITYTPAPDFIATEVFSYTLTDPAGAVASANVTVVIDANPPLAVDDGATTNEDETVVVSVLANDSFVDPASLVISIPPASGTAVVGSGGTIAYTPDADTFGVDTLQYSVSGPGGGIASAFVSIMVTAVNDTPVAIDDTATTDEDVSVTIAVTLNDTDLDGDALTVTSVGNPAAGTTVLNPDQSITYTPHPDAYGVDTFLYTLSDPSNAMAAGQVTVMVNAVNDPPVAFDDHASTSQGTPVTIAILANDQDVDGDTLTLATVATPANGTLVLNGNGTITYTPSPELIAPEVFPYTVTDSSGAAASASVTVVIDPNPPIAVADSALTDEDEAVVIAVLANDAFVDPASLAISVPPVSGTAIIGSGGTIAYTPDADTFGVDSLQYSVSGPGGGVADALVSIQVMAVNDVPVATDDTATTDEDLSVTIAVLINDTDVDGDSLTVTLVGHPAAGTAILNPDQSIRYTPDPNANGVDTFQYTLSDPSNATAIGQVTVAVNAVNDPPVAFDDNASTPQGTAVTIPVLANDQDADGDPLTVATVATPASGAAVLNGDGTITYTPSPDGIATEFFNYTVQDPSGATASAIVTVVIDPNPPVAVADSATTDEDTAVVIAVLANDSFVDPDSLVVSVFPTRGTAVIGAGGTILYTPDPDTFGVDTLHYSVSGPGGGVADALVSIQVMAVNDAPVATDDTATTDEDVPVTIVVLVNDTDVDGDPLTVTLVGSPAAGAATLNPDQSFTYTPDPDANGVDGFQYTLNDPSNATAVGQVTVLVNAVNDPPVAFDDNASTPQGTAVTIAVLANDQDADGDSLAVALVATPANGAAALNGDGTITYTPAPDFIATEVFLYTITDTSGATASASVTVVIDATPPLAIADSATTNEDEVAVIAVLANDSFVDPASLAISVPAASGTAVVGAAGTIAYTPHPDTFGLDTFQYSVSGPGGGLANALVSIQVLAVNDAPLATPDVVTTPEDTPLTIAVLANDTDVDGDPLTVTLLGVPAAGTAVLNPDDTVTYTPVLDFTGVVDCSYTVADPSGAMAESLITVSVTPLNDPPSAEDDVAVTLEDEAVTVFVLLNDLDGDADPLTVSLLVPPSHGSASVNEDGSITYTPELNYFGLDAFQYAASDPLLVSDIAEVVVDVIPVNDAPVAVNDSINTPQGTEVVIAVLENDTDIDGDLLTVISVGGALQGAAAVRPDQTIVYTPLPESIVTEVLEYTVSDPSGGTALATITVTIDPHPPEAIDDVATTDEDIVLTLDVLANDSFVDPLTLIVSTPPQEGEAAVTEAGTILYTPDPDYNGVDAFEYTVGGPGGAGVTAGVSVTINPVNDAPAPVADAVTTPEDVAVVVDVLANDGDVDGDLLTVVGFSDPDHGTISVNEEGVINYTPDPDYNGQDAFAYTVRDPWNALAEAVVSLMITPVNDPPVAAPDAATALQASTVVISVLDNDTDADGDSLVVNAVQDPPHGSAWINPDHTIAYSSDADFTGSDQFEYTVRDSSQAATTALVTVVVTPSPPDARDDFASVDEDQTVTIDTLANDSFFEPSTLTIAGTPSHGTAVVDPSFRINYTPNTDFNGTDTIHYAVSGPGGDADATVFINVNPVNDPPHGTNDAGVTQEDVPITLAVLANDSDPDGDILIVTSVMDPAHGNAVVNSGATITYTPEQNYSGADAFQYTLEDEAGVTDTATVYVTIDATNDPPVAVSDSVTTPQGIAVSISVLQNDSDGDGDPLTVTRATNPAHGIATVNADNTITYSPVATFVGTDVFQYTVRDPQGSTDSALIVVVVSAGSPETANDSASTDEDELVVIDVLANDSYVDASTLAIIAAPQNGTAVVDTQHRVRYTPSSNFNGTDAFLYSAGGPGGSDTALVTIVINSVNDAPTAVNDTGSTPEDTPVTVSVLANDHDVDGDVFTLVAVDDPARGTAVMNGGGSITYTPEPNYHGTDQFQYSLTDGFDASFGTVTIAVGPVNDPPSAADDAATTFQGIPVAINVLENDTDVDGDQVALITVSDPPNGTTVINPDGTITYTPLPAFVGTEQFQYTVSDAASATDSATVEVVIIPDPKDFTFFGVGPDLEFDPEGAEIAFTVPLLLQEEMTSSAFPNAIEGFVMTLSHDPAVLQATGVTPGADLEAADFVMSVITENKIEAQVVLSGALFASSPREVVLADYVTASLRGNPVTVQTQLTWQSGTSNSVVISGAAFNAGSVDIPVVFTALSPAAGTLSYFAPSQGIVYDPATGDTTPSQPEVPVYLEDGGPARLIDGFAVGLAHDPGFLDAVSVAAGAALGGFNGGAGPDTFTAQILSTGVVVTVVIDFDGSEFLEANTAQEVIAVRYSTAPAPLAGDVDGATTPLTFTNDLEESGVLNTVTSGGSNQVPNLGAGVLHFTPLAP